MISFRIAGQSWLRRSPFVLVAFLATCSQSPGQTLQPEKPESNIVRGTVINAVTQAPIPRALVLTRDNRVGVLADGEGHFEISLPEQSSSAGGGMIFSGPQRPFPYVRRNNVYWFIARKPGFLDDPESSRASASSDGELKIALLPEAIIKGRITLAGGDAALGITVQLFSGHVQDGLPRWSQGQTVRANSTGEFRFAELRPGSYKLVTHEFMDNDPITNIPGSQQYGFPPVYYPGVSDFSAAETIELTAGQEFQADMSLVRQPYYPVKIPIANGDITGGLNVSVQGQRGPGYALGYNGGEQRIEGLLPSGTYTVQAATFGQNSVNGSVSIRLTGAPVDGPAMTLVPNSSIAIDVKEEFNDTASNASASWSDGKRTFALHGPRTYMEASVQNADDFAQQPGGSIRSPQGSNDESLVLENLTPGRYWLRLHTSRGYIASAMQGNTDVSRQPLTVGSGPAAPIEVKVRDDGAELDGRVIPLTQRSAMNEDSSETGVWLVCVPLPGSGGELTQLGVSSDGKFTATNLAPGDYRVLAFSRVQMLLPYRDTEAMKAYESKGPVVHLVAGQKATVDVPTILNE